MLKSLYIDNIAVIEHAEPVFSSGLNILTGETGAGKSIIVDSINAILGERTSRDLIRNGSNNARIVAVFDNVSKECREVFENYEIYDDNGSYIISRTLSLSGKNTCKINNIPVNTIVLKEIGKHLITIHGQHDNQLLLSAENHIFFVDNFAKNKDLIDDYKKSFNEFKEVRKQLKNIVDNEEIKAQRLDILKFNVNELNLADIRPGEVEELKTRLILLENYEKIEKILNRISNSNEADGSSYVTTLSNVSTSLLKYNDFSKELGKLNDKINNVVYELYDILEDSEKILSSFGNNETELENTRNRLDLINSLMRKHNTTEEGLLKLKNEQQNELEKIEFDNNNKVNLENKLVELQEQLIRKAKKITNSRKEAANILATQVCNVLEFLDMGGVTFEVSFSSGSYTSNGCDTLEFLISTNKGQESLPLAKIASGGELSRIMLAIKSVLADVDTIDTLIFDEIDTGISGKAARKIGIQLKNVSKLRQVLCITHLAQIAAMADNHLLIVKNQNENSVSTIVKQIENEERILEVARIMSGSEITDNLYNSAKELVESEI